MSSTTGKRVGFALMLLAGIRPAGAQSVPVPAPIQVLDVRVTSEFNQTSTTTLADIPGLTVTLQAGATYTSEGTLYTRSASTGGVKVAFGGTATMTSMRCSLGIQDYNAPYGFAGDFVTAQTTAVGLTSVAKGLIQTFCQMTINAAGTVTIQFAQNAADAGASACASTAGSCVLTGSYWRIRQVP